MSTDIICPNTSRACEKNCWQRCAPVIEPLAYENKRVMEPLVEALAAECRDGEFVIYRSAFRWLKHTGVFGRGDVLPNCYEMFELQSVLDQAGLECRYSFEHAAIVGRRADV